MKGALAAAVLLLLPNPALAQRTRSPADATVFVRLIGSVHAEFEDVDGKQVVDIDRVEIGSGSGFVISPDGYVLTNEHVVRSADQFKVTKGLQRATFTLRVASINVCFRPDAARTHGLIAPCVPASVTASDATRDLAVLYITGSGFPYIALGDSDAIAPGLAVDALGYPFGRDTEVGKIATVQDIVPDVSTTSGTVSALRNNDAGERQYLQITNSVNPGNSGGPILTRDGFAVGVLRSRLENAAGIGFAIVINDAKDFLETRGLDALMPVRRLRLGSLQPLEPKRLAMRLPEGFSDSSPFVSHVEAGGRGADIALRIDRVLSPWPAKQIEQTLIGSRTFEPLQMTARDNRGSAPQPADSTVLIGGAASGDEPGREFRIDYGVLDLEGETLIARYVGSAEWMAFNESALRESLNSLQGRRFAPQSYAPESLSWSAAPSASGEAVVPLPAGWTVQPGAPAPCAGLPRPGATTVASAAEDPSIQLRAAAWPGADITPDAAATACSSRRGSLGTASYAQTTTWLGVSYVIEGVFARVGSKLVQLEVLAPDQRGALARGLLGAWLKKISE
jgi:S1-C subfamily serine protease